MCDFEVAIPAGQICSAHLFEMESYGHFATRAPKGKPSRKTLAGVNLFHPERPLDLPHSAR